MIDQKAKEYAEKLLQHVHPDEPMECDASELQQDIEAAYRAGYQAGVECGKIEATRREFVQPQQDSFFRGLDR